MTATGRAILGAASGALITLCVHPVSRPFMLGVTSRASPELLSQCVDANAAVLPAPTTLPHASLWMQIAAGKVRKHLVLSEKERLSILGIAAAAENKERNNAFWPEMEAIVYDEGGQTAQAIDAWTRASTKTNWNDHQTNRLLTARVLIEQVTGVKQAWQLAYLYYSRSDDFAICLERVARTILATAENDTVPGLTLRMATIRNGELLRAHAQSSKTNIMAMNIVDLATYPAARISESNGASPKKLEIGEGKILSNLVKILHRPDWALEAKTAFKSSESWSAFTVHDSNDQQSEFLAVGTVLTSSVASAVFVVAVMGGIIWSIGMLVAWRLSRAKEIKPYVAIVLAIFLGGAVDFLTGSLLAAFALALCGAFLTVAPDRSRKARPEDIGPFFSFLAIVLGLVCSLMFVSYLIGTTPAANAILPKMGVPADYIDKPLLAGLSAVSFGLVLLMAPIWAVVHRLGTPYVLALALRRFGKFIAATGLTLSVMLGPVSVYADRQLDSTFTELVTNEPVHYYIHR